MSRNPALNSDFNFIPNIKDAMLFSFKKTVGSFKFNTLKNKRMNDLLSYYHYISYDIKNIYYNLLYIIIQNKKDDLYFLNNNNKELEIINESDILYFFDKILILLYKHFIPIYKNNFNNKKFQHNYFNIISNILNLENNLQNIIYIFKITLEILNKNNKILCDYIPINLLEIIIDNIEEKNIKSLTIKNLHITIKKKIIFEIEIEI
jgi:hypothetical protein